MSKHLRSLSSASHHAQESTTKRSRPSQPAFNPKRVATAAAAAAVDADPPLHRLLAALERSIKKPTKGDSVVYWMRMSDLRTSDNRALSLASKKAKAEGIPLVVLFTLSPQDYVAHDRSSRRIDFTLRNLVTIKKTLADLNIPLHSITHTPRTTLASRVLEFSLSLGCTNIYANMEYEVDELRRDITFCGLAKPKGLKPVFLHDKCIVEPGTILTKDNKSYAVYSPYQRNWLTTLNGNLPYYLEECPMPHPNDTSILNTKQFSDLFDTPVPSFIPGFELEQEDSNKMIEIWPAGQEAAVEILHRFLATKSRSSQLGAVDPIALGAEESSKSSRILNYDKERDRADSDTTSRMSAYLSAGVISARACVRATMLLLKSDKVDGGRTSGIGRWVQELAWRDFYICVLTGFPRVSMGRPFLERLSSVVWEEHQGPESNVHGGTHPNRDTETLRRWKEGQTGVPIVDAAMRCLNKMGWVHNRMRMITAMFLTKDLMIDWRVGERYFMQQLIDGDLASNNGGWQWSASTGVDPCPYFRIFNPYTQSLKADPSGNFIRHWVPELRGLRGNDLHKPPQSIADKIGYPRPIVKHEEARHRALRRFKNPGEA